MGLVIEGNTLATISLREHMPSYRTMQRWLATDGAFRDRYDGALTFQQHVMADDVLKIADDYAAAQRGRARIKAVRLQIDARNWWIAWHEKEEKRLAPKKGNAQQEFMEELKCRLERARRENAAAYGLA
jgi:Cdc6-like AAA superfamily ATPase